LPHLTTNMKVVTFYYEIFTVYYV